MNKGAAEKSDVGCRLVVRDFKPKWEKDREDLFAAMPPLEAKRLSFAVAAAGKRQWRSGRRTRPKLMFIDIRKAHLNGKLSEEELAYVSAPTQNMEIPWSMTGKMGNPLSATGKLKIL